MEILIGLLIIAVGAFCQSSCYVPINRIKDWSWESYWIVQGVFAWLIFPFLGALLAVPEGHSLSDLFTTENSFDIIMTIIFGALWGVGGLTIGTIDCLRNMCRIGNDYGSCLAEPVFP